MKKYRIPSRKEFEDKENEYYNSDVYKNECDFLPKIANGEISNYDIPIREELTENKINLELGLVSESEEVEVIPIASDYEFIKELPENILNKFDNCIIDKGITGCGFTSYYLQNKEDIILLVPRKEIITSKEEQEHKNKRNDIFYVYGSLDGDKEDAIKDYILMCTKSNKPIKIMGTYDSIMCIINGISISDKEFGGIKLVIDEYQFLLLDWAFRYKQIDIMYQTFDRWKHIVFISATPIKRKYLHSALIKFPEIKLDWKQKPFPEIKKICCKSAKNLVKSMIEKRLDCKSLNNLYIFCNSVNLIIKIIQELKEKNIELNRNNTKIVCSKDKEKVFEEKELTISRLDKKDKDEGGDYYPINFITSSAYAGADCYDKNNQICIISSEYYRNTQNDISLEIKQILGRFRFGCFTIPEHYIQHSYKLKTSDRDLLIFKKYVYKKFNMSKEFIEAQNALLSEKFNHFSFYQEKEKILRENYYLKTTNSYDDNPETLVLDEYMPKYDIFKAESRINLFENYETSAKNSKITVMEKASNKLAKNSSAKVCFEESFFEYCKLKSSEKNKQCSNTDIQRMALLENRYTFINDAYCILGEEKVKELKYKVSNVKYEIQRAKDIKCLQSNQVVIKYEFLNKFKENELYSKKEIKDWLGILYKCLGVNIKAKATDIIQYFEQNELNFEDTSRYIKYTRF